MLVVCWLAQATQQAKMIKDGNPYRTLMQKQYRPQLLITVLVSFTLHDVCMAQQRLHLAVVTLRAAATAASACRAFGGMQALECYACTCADCAPSHLQMPFFQQFTGINAGLLRIVNDCIWLLPHARAGPATE